MLASKVSNLEKIFKCIYIATDKKGIHILFFLFLDENICCWYSLEAPRRGASNEHHNICFRREIRKISAFFE